MINIHHL